MTVETKFNEVRKVTSNPREMLNMYTTKRICKTWIEDFLDEDSGEVVPIERSEVLFDKGIVIDQDVLAQINFFISAGDITEVEVSNQQRMANQLERNYLHPFIAQVQVGSKKIKFLFYSNTIESAFDLLKDYVELHYSNGFYIRMIKEYDSCIILTDTLNKASTDIPFEEWDSIDEDSIDDEESADKKFYQIECTINYDDDCSMIQDFVVHSFNVDRCMMLINHYIQNQQKVEEKRAIERNEAFEKKEFQTMIETAKIISIGCFIPKEFSEAYK